MPSCRLSLSQVIDRSELVCEGLEKLSATHGTKLIRLDPAWYGFDPIHVRPSLWRSAWQQILGVSSEAQSNRGSMVESVKLYCLRPERRWMFGVEQCTPQSGVALRSGGQVRLY